jgi:hypothetical protein
LLPLGKNGEASPKLKRINMFEFSAAALGDPVTADDIVVIVKAFGRREAYLFGREFYNEFERFISDRFHAADEDREDFETVEEHLGRIGCKFEFLEFTADGVWEGNLHE